MPITNTIEIVSKTAAGDIDVDFIPSGRNITTPTLGKEWAAAVVESYNVAGQGTNGDYATIIRIDGGDQPSGNLEYTLVRGSDGDVIVGNTLVYYNPFASAFTIEPDSVVARGGGGWREDYIVAGAVWKRSDGLYFMLVRGNDHTENSVGYATSPDLHTWTLQNGDAPIITNAHASIPVGWGADGNINCTSTLIWIPGEGKYITLLTYNVGTETRIGWWKFAPDIEDETEWEFSTGDILDLAPPVNGTGHAWPCLFEWGGEFYIAFIRKGETILDYDLWWAKAATVDSEAYSTAGLTNPMITIDHNDDATYYSNHSLSATCFVWNGELCMLHVGTARWSASGTRGNAVFGLWKWNGSVWVEDSRNPIMHHPMGANATLWGSDYTWMQDHMGADLPIIYDANLGRLHLYPSLINGTDEYEIAHWWYDVAGV